MNYLLDTCVICEMMKKRPDEKVVKWFCKQVPKTLYLSYLTIGEIQKGIVKRGDDARAKRLKTWLEKKILPFYDGRILPVEKKVATEWGRICGESERNGKTRPSVDALIAATASVHKMKLVTRNERDMSGMGVPLLNPFDGSVS